MSACPPNYRLLLGSCQVLEYESEAAARQGHKNCPDLGRVWLQRRTAWDRYEWETLARLEGGAE